MTTRETLLQAVRSWFKTALSIPDDKIIKEDQPVRPAIPYLTIKLTLADQTVGVDEVVREISGGDAPTVRGRGIRRGSLSVQGHGSDSAGWLEVAALRLVRPSIQAILDAAGLTVINQGGALDISALVDTAIEPRFLREFPIGYAFLDEDAEELVEMKRVEVETTFRKFPDDPNLLSTTIIVDLT